MVSTAKGALPGGHWSRVIGQWARLMEREEELRLQFSVFSVGVKRVEVEDTFSIIQSAATWFHQHNTIFLNLS